MWGGKKVRMCALRSVEGEMGGYVCVLDWQRGWEWGEVKCVGWEGGAHVCVEVGRG